MSESKINKILYGGDYNPEQWPEEIWEEDMRLFKKANIDVVTLNVFSWAMLQPSEEVYDFSKLDKIMDLVRSNDIKVCLATSTSSHPAWMAKRHPDILRVENGGRKRKFGARHNSCPNSPTYKKYASELVKKLANRYKDYDNIVAWHISNELSGMCYCENCAQAFREWIKERYGTIEAVNKAYNTSFWSHTFYDFDEIEPSDLRSEEFVYWDGSGAIRTNFQGISLDYNRFMSDSILGMYTMERDIIKEITPDIPCTTNFMGWYKDMDYGKWIKEMDIVSWDNYPPSEDSMEVPASMSDAMRSLGGGKPFWLMEQTPSVSNWHAYCKLKRPGVMRLWSYQSVAHGSDTVMYFQMRRSIGACEKYHGAIIDHVGTDETRVFKEAAEIGRELTLIGDQILGATTDAKVAIVLDWETWWASELSAGPSNLISYLGEVLTYYRALWKKNIAVDFVRTDDDFSKYSLLIAPLLYMNKEGFDDSVRDFVNAGGTYITTYFSGYVNENDLVILGGYPGKQKDIIGAWIEESDAYGPDESNSFIYKGKEHKAEILCDIIRLRGAVSLAEYTKDFYANTPVITKNTFGKGYAYYVGTRSDDDFYREFLGDICEEIGISPVSMPTCDKEALLQKIEITCRSNENGSFYFYLNHNSEEVSLKNFVTGTDILSGKTYSEEDTLVLGPKDVAIIKA